MKNILIALLFFPAILVLVAFTNARAQCAGDTLVPYATTCAVLDSSVMQPQPLPCWDFPCPVEASHRWYVADTAPFFFVETCGPIVGPIQVQVFSSCNTMVFDTGCVCIDSPCDKFAYLLGIPAGSHIVVSGMAGAMVFILMEPQPSGIQVPPLTPIALIDTLCGAFYQEEVFDEPAGQDPAPRPVIDMRTFKVIRREDMAPRSIYKEFH